MRNSHSLADIVNCLIKSNLEANLPLKKEGLYDNENNPPNNTPPNNDLDAQLARYALEQRQAADKLRQEMFAQVTPLIKDMFSARMQDRELDRTLRLKSTELDNWTKAINALVPLLTLVLHARNRPQQSDPFTALINSAFSGFRIPSVPNPFQQAQGMIG
jgi:hypothetical protein